MNAQPQDNLTVSLAELDACAITLSYQVLKDLKGAGDFLPTLIASAKLSIFLNFIRTLNEKAGRQTVIDNLHASTLTDAQIEEAFMVTRKLFERLSMHGDANFITKAE